jgi:hypothetical protein
VTFATSRARRVDKWDERKKAYLRYIARSGVALALDGRRGARWAKGPRGVVAILGASEAPGGGRWFLGLNEEQFQERNPVGLVLLCEQGEKLLDFAVPAERLRTLLGGLSKVRGERKINLVRVRDRYVIQVPGSEGADVTDTLGNLGALGSSTDTPASSAGTPSTKEVAGSRGERRFFAKVRRGRLVPLDPIELKDGEVLLVEIERIPAAPGHASLRHIVALGGPSDLPSDLATQHDHYARGTPRR